MINIKLMVRCVCSTRKTIQLQRRQKFRIKSKLIMLTIFRRRLVTTTILKNQPSIRNVTKFNHFKRRWCSTSSDGSTPSSSQAPTTNEQPLTLKKATYYKNPKVVHQVTQAFIKAGFSEENYSQIIDTYPNILCIHPMEIERRLEMWTRHHFSRPQYYQLFVQCPELLEFDDETAITKRISKLTSVVATAKNVWRLLMSSPNVLIDDANVILKKIDYVLREMEADVTDLVKSGTLGLPLKTIRMRHVLMMRLGLYKKRNWKESELSTSKNPRLCRIMDVSDEEFAQKVCRISMKEMEAFDDLYERELDELAKEYADYEDIESDSEDEWDEDDAEFDARENADYYDDRQRRRYLKYNSQKKTTK